MKKVLSFFMVLISLVLPFLSVSTVNASEKEPVKFYIFYGEGCPHCTELHGWIDDTLSKDEEYKDMYEVVNIEVWNDADNSDFMEDVAEYFQYNLRGVPFYVIGTKCYSGFSKDNSPAQIKAAIKEAYENPEYEDVVAKLGAARSDKNRNENKDMTGYIILAITAVAVVAIIFGRSKTSYYDDANESLDDSEEIKEEVKEEIKEDSKEKTNKTPAKKTTKDTEEKKKTSMPKKTTKAKTTSASETKKSSTKTGADKKKTTVKKNTTKKTTSKSTSTKKNTK